MNSRVTCLLVFAAVIVKVNSDLKLTILHTNDMHSRFQEIDAHSGICRGKAKCYGGFARVRAAVDRMRKQAGTEGRESIFINAGDSYQGSAMFTMLKWKVVSELVNMLGLDVMSLGNHEFDDGPAGLAPFLKNSTVPVVCCNIDFSKEPALRDPKDRPSLTASKILEVNGVKIGVIGYLTTETMFISSVGNVEILDEIENIKKEAQRLKGEGIKILIALGHAGYAKDQQIATEVPDIDVVVGGHTNTFLYTGNPPDIEKSEGPYPTVVTQSSGRKVMVVQAYAYTKYLGVLKVDFNNDGEIVEASGNPVLLDQSFEKDKAVDEAVTQLASTVGNITGKKVGSSKAFLESDQACRMKECNFGNLVTDAMIYDNAKDFFGKGWTDAPVAFVQGGSLRASFNPEYSNGDIKYGDVLLAMPFTNSVEKLTIKGSALKDALEHSVSAYSIQERPGGFFQYSGIRVRYDLDKAPKERVDEALVRCGDCPIPKYLPLDPEADYNILTNSFLANGGDGFVMLQSASKRVSLSYSDVDAVVDYLQHMSPVYPEMTGRISFVKDPENSGGLARASLILVASVVLTTQYM